MRDPRACCKDYCIGRLCASCDQCENCECPKCSDCGTPEKHTDVCENCINADYRRSEMGGAGKGTER